MIIKLNIIPDYKKAEIKKTFRLRRILKWEGEFLLIVFLFIAGLLSVDYILKINLSSANYGLSMITNGSNQYKSIEKYDNAIKDMNKLVSDVSKIQSSQIYWSKFFTKFNEKVVTGIGIESLSNQNYMVSVMGKADTRDSLLVFKESIEKDDCFEGVDLPLSYLVSQKDVSFQMNFKIKKECLK
jgi:hypothetical protein